MKVRVCRPSGGLGDVVMCLSACHGLQLKYPEAEVVFFNRKDYSEILDRCPDVDRWHPTKWEGGRRSRSSSPDNENHPYLNQESGPWGQTVDLWCPAWPHETNHPNPVTKSRVQLFAEAAGVWSFIEGDPRPRLRLTAQDHREARQWFESQGVRPSQCIGWQPFPTCSTRRWPVQKVKTAMQWFRFALGKRTIIFDVVPNRVEHAFSDGGALHCVGERLGLVAAIVQRLPCVLGPDSSFTHLCGAAGIDTPHISICGKTGGHVLTQPYPLGRFIQGDGSLDGCEAPCWHRRQRGWDKDKCRSSGCPAVESIPVSRVYPEVERVLGARSGF